MPDSQPLDIRTRIAKSLIADFGKSTTQFKTLNSRYMVSADLVLNYISQYISLFDNKDELRNAPKLLLHHLHLVDTLALPPGFYPSIEIEHCSFIGGLHLGDATVYGAFTVSNNANTAPGDFSATFINLSIESQFHITNYIGKAISFHACKLQDLIVESSVQKLRIDRKSRISGNCYLQACPDVGIGEVEFSGGFTYMPTGTGDEVEIMDCMYSGEAIFARNGHPIRFLSIHDTEFHKGLRFASPVNEEADFSRVKFFFQADFQNTEFHAKTSFDGCEFHCAPEFFGATLFPDTAFQKAKFLAFDGESQYAAYRELRHLSHDMLKSAQDESRFFAYEQRALANVQVKTKGKRLEGYLSKLYGLASDYGQSIIRPFFGLIGINAPFGVSYAAIPSATIVAEAATQVGAWHTRIPESVGLMLQNLFQPFAILGKTATYLPSCWQVALLSGLQTVLSLALFALFILAIRRRFRKGSE